MSSNQTVAEASGSGASNSMVIEGFRPGPKGIKKDMWCYTARDTFGNKLFTAAGHRGLQTALEGYGENSTGLVAPSNDILMNAAKKVGYRSHPVSGREQITFDCELRGKYWSIEPRKQDTPIPRDAPIPDYDSFKVEELSVGETSVEMSTAVEAVDRSKWSATSRGEVPGQRPIIFVSRAQGSSKDEGYLASDPGSEATYFASGVPQLRRALATITASPAPGEKAFRSLGTASSGKVKATLASNNRWYISPIKIRR